ncbi:family 20 glycosylhydrolase [Rubritalea tangerina]|uniref:beta-N-acetylhexosaminidase n=2 Tax=Rubritalea tangerina TaxID=430798 RepID=A0ABW4ZC50_9BACT
MSAILLRADDSRVQAAQPGLLPLPQALEWGEQAIAFEKVKVVLPQVKDAPLRMRQIETELQALLKRNKVAVADDASQQIRLRIGKIEVPGQWEGQEDEAYSLVAEKRGVVITANTVSGLYYGVQTLRQLMVHKDGKATVAACDITDYPAFKIRGLMHDVGRNFQTLDQLKMQIEVMAKHKLNVFHFHCTEYHGWRLESKIYPNLQADSSFTRKPGKYYTQKEFIDLVDFCWARNITVIPEFDSPGHSDAFMKGVGVDNMKDPKALKAITELIDELCSLVPKEKMPYVHVGTDEVRQAKQRVNADYLPALHKCVQDNGREVIGWCSGMTFKGAKQVAQTWAKSNPWGGCQHIDSRSNYVNHLEALDFGVRMFFQQPCRQPNGDSIQLGGVLCHWPDTKVDDEKLILTNNPVIPAFVAYSEGVWKGHAGNYGGYWAKLPSKGTAEYEAYADFEDRIAEQRDRFHSNVPFPMVKTYPIEWRLLGQVADGAVPDLEKGIVKESYDVDGAKFNWSKPVYGGAIHSRHFFGFASHYGGKPKGKDIVWGNTHVYSPVDQEVDAWIGFNTISTSDDRAGSALDGYWSSNKACAIWINGEKVNPPKWANPGKLGKELALIDNVYTSREPAKIKLKKGWNTVLVKSAPTWKWVFSFSPVEKHGLSYREVEGLKYSATKP